MGDTSYTELQSGAIIKATPVDGNPNAISIITGTQEPFNKIFKNGITVQDSAAEGNRALIETDLAVSGSMIYENIYSYSGGATTLTKTQFGDTSVLLISPNSGVVVTVELPATTSAIAGQAKLYIIKKLSALGTVTINPNSTAQIDGATSVSATAQYSYIQVIYSGNSTDDYLIIANNGFS